MNKTRLLILNFRHYLLIAACKTVVFGFLIALAGAILFQPFSSERAAVVLVLSVIVLVLHEAAADRICSLRRRSISSGGGGRRQASRVANGGSLLERERNEEDLQRIAGLPVAEILDDIWQITPVIEADARHFQNLNPQQFTFLSKIFLETAINAYGKEASAIKLGELKSFIAGNRQAHALLCKTFIENYHSYLAGSFHDNFLDALEGAGELWADVICIEERERQQTGRIN